MKGYDHAFLYRPKAMARKWRRMSGQQMKNAAEGLHHRSGSAILLRQLPRGTPSRGTEPYTDWQGLALETSFCRTARTTLNGRNRTVSCSWRRVFQPDGISVYCSVMLSLVMRALSSYCSNHQQTPTYCNSIFTTTLHCDTIFAMVMRSIAVASSRQYNENYYH